MDNDVPQTKPYFAKLHHELACACNQETKISNLTAFAYFKSTKWEI